MGSRVESRRTGKPDAPARVASDVLRVRLLGGFGVSLGATSIHEGTWRLKKAAALVKLLALAPGHRLHRDQVMDLLWPDLGRKAAANNLRQALHAARRAIHPEAGSAYLHSGDESLVLCPYGRLWVDVSAFEAAAARARRSGDPAVYGAAIDLYAGDLLPGDRYEGWAEDRREGLRQLYLALLLGLARVLEGRREYGPASEALRRALAEEPTGEEAHAAQMRLLALSGRPEAALAQYERLRDALHRGIGGEPAAATRELRDRIAAGTFVTGAAEQTPRAAPAGGKHNLPAQRTRFIGRERELVAVQRELATTRLLTLTGAGGAGKTRLAVEIGRMLAALYEDGVRLTELASLSEPGLVAAEVAAALGVAERPGQALSETLVETLRDEETLLILDNCEHVIEAAARLADLLLCGCPRLKVLATSREPLGVPGEVLWRVPPLSLPEGVEETVEGLVRYEAVRLFVDRARLRLPGFPLTEENAPAIARVCRKLDGIPLAIELATARMGALAVEQVAQRLEASLDVLGAGGRAVEPRQRTLRATLDWSYDLLSEPEQTFFGRLSVFAGGWMLEAAEAVGSGGSIGRNDVLDLLGGLVDKSLAIASAVPGGAVRYRMLEPIRQYARDKLEESGEAEGVRDRHAEYFLARAEEAAPQLEGTDQSLWVARLQRDLDNIRAALRWVLDREDDGRLLRFSAALCRFWQIRAYFSEGIEWLELTLQKSDPAPSPGRVAVYDGLGRLAQSQSDTVRARRAFEELLRLSRAVGDMGSAATALNSLGTLAVMAGEHGRARAFLGENLRVLERLEEERNPSTGLKRHFALNLLGALAIYHENDYVRGAQLWEEGLALVREGGHDYETLHTLCNLSYARILQHDYEGAAALAAEALALSRRVSEAGTAVIPEIHVNAGLAARAMGHTEAAVDSFREALSRAQEVGIKSSAINALEGMTGLVGRPAAAALTARLWGAAQAAREATGTPLPIGELELHEPYLTTARAELGEEAYEAARVEGRAMTLPEAAEYAIHAAQGSSDLPNAQPGQEPALSAREEEVAALVARGLTNRQISSRLHISERTAGNHVGRILRKLGLRSRAQIAAWAVERRSLPPAAT